MALGREFRNFRRLLCGQRGSLCKAGGPKNNADRTAGHARPNIPAEKGNNMGQELPV
jgi:hypothetical protein